MKINLNMRKGVKMLTVCRFSILFIIFGIVFKCRKKKETKNKIIIDGPTSSFISTSINGEKKLSNFIMNWNKLELRNSHFISTTTPIARSLCILIIEMKR